MKKKLLLAALLAMVMLVAVLPAAVFADAAAESDFTFDSSTGTITGYTGTSGTLVIPAKINGVDVVAIGENAFYYCMNLTSVTFPEGVTSIGAGAFYDCEYLGYNSNVTIPATVTSIGNSAFYNCSSLANVTVLATEPPTLGNEPFFGISNAAVLTVHTSTDRVEAYQNSDWSSYFATIAAAEHDTNGEGGACSVCGYKAGPADYTAVNTAKGRFAAINAASYTEASVKAVEDAIAAVVEGKKIDEQDVVDGFAKAINDAIDALVPNVAAINETTPYPTLAEAVAAAKSGDTITLLADSDESFTLPVGVTFDVSGYAYTGTVSAPENYEVVTAEGVYTVCNHTYGMWVSKDATTHSRTCDQCGVAEPGSHNWNAPSFLWSFTANGGVMATYRTTCSVCGYTSSETNAVVSYVENGNNVVWTATVTIDEKTYTETKTVAKTYTVTVPDGFTGGGGYEYGKTVTVKPNRSGHYNFSLNGARSAINATSLTFKK